ncbi:cullin-4A [Trichonephila clavipes]|nr:cullin-4A [Trichonephila clavipes]
MVQNNVVRRQKSPLVAEQCEVNIQSINQAAENPSCRRVDAPYVNRGLGSNPGEGMDVCKCIVPSRYGDTLNSHRAASPLVRLVEEEEMWESPDHPQGVLPQNCNGTKQNLTVTYMVLKTKAYDKRKNLALSHDEFRRP